MMISVVALLLLFGGGAAVLGLIVFAIASKKLWIIPVAGALVEVPAANSIWGGDHIRRFDRVDIAADVQRDDVRAVRRQPDRMCATLAPCRSGDEGDFAI